MIAAAVAGVSVLSAGAAFGYNLYLKGALERKSAQLAEAQSDVSIDTVEGFIRLKNRLSSVEQLLDQHVYLTEFLDVLELRTLQTVRFSSLSVSVSPDRSALIEMEGTARSFNALAAQSSEFAAEKNIKRAIFSGISVNENGTVAFSLTATVESRLITSAEILPGIPNTSVPAPASAAVPPANIAPVAPATSTATSTPSRPATTTAPAL